jgi:3'(2'), 5'-bisphosphate nucleotidase
MNSSDAGARARILADVVRLTQRAGAALVAMQRAGALETRAKADGSPLTRADEAAHALLASGLAQIAPYGVFSEESEPHENAQRRSSARLWIVDPLDGTRDYIRGSNAFSVNVALVENGVPVLGVIDAPGLGVTYYAQRGAGAFRLAAGTAPQALRCARSIVDGARIVVSGSDRRVAWSAVACFARARVEAVSSSVKLGFVADATAFAYPRLTPSSEWDIAAGHAILAEAGGRVIGPDGRDLTYNKIDPLNPAFVATGVPAVAAELTAILTAMRTE